MDYTVFLFGSSRYGVSFTRTGLPVGKDGTVTAIENFVNLPFNLLENVFLCGSLTQNVRRELVVLLRFALSNTDDLFVFS